MISRSFERPERTARAASAARRRHRMRYTRHEDRSTSCLVSTRPSNGHPHASTAAATDKPTRRSGASCSPAAHTDPNELSRLDALRKSLDPAGLPLPVVPSWAGRWERHRRGPAGRVSMKRGTAKSAERPPLCSDAMGPLPNPAGAPKATTCRYGVSKMNRPLLRSLPRM